MASQGMSLESRAPMSSAFGRPSAGNMVSAHILVSNVTSFWVLSDVIIPSLLSPLPSLCSPSTS